MNAQTKVEAAPVVGLDLLRAPFPDHHISKLPKPTKAQTQAVKDDFKKGARCKQCGSWHHPDVVHLDYVGHAALTDRLLDTDPQWYWEPLAFTEQGLPAFDQTGGLWIKLTVCGVTRLGYGHAAAKQGVDPGAREKEVIGDALRNAAMRFGAALDLWHKGDLHLEEQSEGGGDNSGERQVSPAANTLRGQLEQSVQQEVHHDDTAVKPAKRVNWGGRYPTKTALKQAMHTHHAELERLGIEGTFDDLEGYLTSPEYVDFIATATEHAPYYLDGERHPDAPPEFIQTFTLEAKARDLIALRGNTPAELETN